MLRPRAWIGLTTANPTFASDAGLADRLLVVRMNRRTDETADSKLSEEIAANRDGGLSFIANALARALADKEPTPQNLNLRHPDFGRNGGADRSRHRSGTGNNRGLIPGGKR